MVEGTMDERIKAYILSERQWTRFCRVGHARYRLQEARQEKREEDIEFWTKVIEANTYTLPVTLTGRGG